MEIDYGKFERAVKIAIPVDTDNTSAQYKEGFLRITIPKTTAKQKVIIATPHDE
jgi:HSP20 family molecular chaperone IbpA